MADTIEVLVCEADKLAAAYSHELDYLAKYPNLNAEAGDPLRRLSFAAQQVARRFSDLASKAINAADDALDDPFFPAQKHREELLAETLNGEHS